MSTLPTACSSSHVSRCVSQAVAFALQRISGMRTTGLGASEQNGTHTVAWQPTPAEKTFAEYGDGIYT